MTPDNELILLPGLDGTGTLFHPLEEALPPNIRSRRIVYSANREEPLECLARIVMKEVPAPGKSVIVAESFSSIVLLDSMRRFGFEPRAVVIACGFAVNPWPRLGMLASVLPLELILRHTARTWMACWVLMGSHKGALVDLYRKSIRQVSTSVLRGRIGMILACAAPSRASSVPCLYLRATRDNLVPKNCADVFRKTFLDFRETSIDGPHLLLQARPKECVQAIEAFLGKLADRPTGA